MKTVRAILFLILLASFSLSVVAEKEGRFGFGMRQLLFFSAGGYSVNTINGRHWWKEGIGIEGNIGVFITSAGSRAFRSGSLLFPVFRTIDTKIYLSMGLHANGDACHPNQLFQLLRDILAPLNYSGGYHIGLGVEIVVTKNLTLDLRVEHYENTWGPGAISGAGGIFCKLAAGAGFIYYF